jgi:hypothetical protein
VNVTESKIVNLDHLRLMRENEEDIAEFKEMATVHSFMAAVGP